MQRYPVRTTHRAQLTTPQLAELCRSIFEHAEVDEVEVVVKWGAIARLRTWPEKKELAVDITMDPKVDVTVAAETVRRYNRFLEGATGFSAKERAKRLRKSAGTSDAGA